MEKISFQSKLLKIGEVARRAKTSIHAIRYYEKMGLLAGPLRTSGGFRLYGEDTVQRLLFIQKAKEFGLTLGEIEKITCCGEKGLGPCCDMTVKLFNRKIHEFEAKVLELNRTKRKIKGLLSGWAKGGKRKEI
jgi:DNA-binding transcriptional MerR regulator